MAEARALAPRARVAPFDPARSRHALALLAKWSLRFSPTVSIDPTPDPRSRPADFPDDAPDGLLLDVTGEAHLFGTERLLLVEIATRLARIGFSARLAIAPTLGAAWALARFGPHPLAVVDEEYLQPALQPLPVEALRLEAPAIAGMHQVGIERISHLLRIGRDSLLTRFGEELLLRLDQALGRATEQIDPLHPAEPVAVRRLFDGATTQLEALFISVQELLAELAARLLAQESGIRGLRLELTRINASPASREIVLGAPSRDPRHLWSLLRPKLENMHLGYGVEAITLTAHWTDRIRHRQTGAWGTGEATDTHDEEYAAFLDTLINRWGANRVLAAQPVPSHTPEVARHFTPLQQTANTRPAAQPVEIDLLFVDRPSILFDHPEPAEALALQPDHPPTRLQWRNQEHLLQEGTGPERIATAWWRSSHKTITGRQGTSSTRDYFKVQTQAGAWLWIFREIESGHWFVHGLWG
jgi:protein ImuB